MNSWATVIVAGCPSITVILGALSKSVPCLRLRALIKTDACEEPNIAFPAPNTSPKVESINGDTPSPIAILPGRLGIGFGIFKDASASSGTLMIVSRVVPVGE